MKKKTTIQQISLLNPIIKSDIRIHPELLTSLSYCLMTSGQLLRARMDEIMAEHGLITPHLGILIIIKNSNTVNQLQLGQKLGIDKATIVKLIDILEEKKLVKRITDQNDRRSKIISITSTGKKFTDKMINVRTKIESTFLKDFSHSEQEMIKNIIPKLLLAFQSN